MQWKCNTNWHEWLELHHPIFHVPFPLSHPLLHLSLFFLCTFPRKAPSLNLFVSKSHKRSFLQWKQKWHWFNYRKWYKFCSEKNITFGFWWEKQIVKDLLLLSFPPQYLNDVSFVFGVKILMVPFFSVKINFCLSSYKTKQYMKKIFLLP